jgi:putative transposase
MAATIGLRSDFDGEGLRRLSRASDDAKQVRRLLAVSAIYEGSTRGEAARIGGVTLQIVRDWVVRFNAQGPVGVIDGKAPGGRPLLSDGQRRALARAVEDGAISASHGVVRWRLIDLAQWIRDGSGISISMQPLSRELRAMSYRKLTARPRLHAQDVGVSEISYMGHDDGN